MDFASASRLISLTLIALPFVCSIPPSLSFSVSTAPSQATITIAGQAFVVDPANIVLDGTTVQPGSAGISVDGEVVSADIANDLFVAGIEILTETTSSTLASSAAMNRTASPKSTNVTFSGSSAPTSASAAGTGLTALAGEIAHLAGQLASTYANHTLGNAVSTSVPASTSGVAASSSGSTPLQPAMALSSSLLSNAALATATSNVQANNSQPQSRSSAFDSVPASTSNSFIPTGSSTYINSSSGIYPVAGVSKTSQSAASIPQSVGSAGNPSQSALLAPGAKPNTITTGPTLLFPTLSLNPTGSVASSQGMLLVGAIFGITEKAKTLSAIIKDDGPKISFVSEVKGIEDNVIDLLEDIHPPGPPPSYEDACLDGASIFDIFKDLACLKGGLDEVIAGLEDDSPDIPKIQVIVDNIGKLAENLEEEEDDDDDKTASATDGSSTSMSSRPSMTSNASSRVSSSTSTASVTMQPIDKHPFADPDTSDSDIPGIADQAFMAFLGDVLSSAVGIGPGPSGFAVVTGSANATARLSSSNLMSSTTSAAGTLSSALDLASAAATSGFNNVGNTTSHVIDGESTTSQVVVSSTATNPSSLSSVAADLTSLAGEELSFIASLVAARHSAQSAAVETTTQTPTSTAAAVSAEAIGNALASIVIQVASASAAAVEAAGIASVAAATSSAAALPASSPDPPKTEWGIYLGLQTYTRGGVDPTTDYYYKVWMTDLTQTPAGPDFCGQKNWIANQPINGVGSNYPPYPTGDFGFAIPAGVLQPAELRCIWQPSPANSAPGSLSCDPGGQTVLCTNSTLTGVICKGDNQDRVDPLAECAFSA